MCIRDRWGSVVLGLKVRAPFKLSRLVTRYEVRLMLLALPSVSHRRRRDILETLAGLPVRVMALPTLAELTSGARRIDEFREVGVEDILGRDSVQPNPALLQARVSGKTVMVTGAGGSIGAELCRPVSYTHLDVYKRQRQGLVKKWSGSEY